MVYAVSPISNKTALTNSHLDGSGLFLLCCKAHYCSLRFDNFRRSRPPRLISAGGSMRLEPTVYTPYRGPERRGCVVAVELWFQSRLCVVTN